MNLCLVMDSFGLILDSGLDLDLDELVLTTTPQYMNPKDMRFNFFFFQKNII